LAETQPNLLADAINEARERLAKELSSQAEQLQKLVESVTELRQRHERTTEEAEQQWQALARVEASVPRVSPETVLENVLGAVRNLMTCTLPEQVLQVLAEEAAQWAVRAAVFDVRGKAAWGAAAKGFGPELTEKVFRGLVIPLNQGNPFRQVCEIGGHVDTNVRALKKNRNVLEKLKPTADDPILLLPIRSAGAVAAIFYADPGGKGEPLPVNALKILSEFAGAQLDRLMALSGGFSPESVGEESAPPPVADAPVEEVAVEAVVDVPPAADVAPEVREEAVASETPTGESPAPPAEVSAPAVEPVVAEVESEPAPPPPEKATAEDGTPLPLVDVAPGEEVAVVPAPEAQPEPEPAPADSDVSRLSEAEQKIHKDARRFAKLLVSEIELYNKAKVADGRKNKDVYKRLKTDIDRSRQTFDKRFGKTLGKEFDYFRDELVRILAASDSTALGPEYPGPSA
jgi:vacuolar-type H+-ATPase subunit H